MSENLFLESIQVLFIDKIIEKWPARPSFLEIIILEGLFFIFSIIFNTSYFQEENGLHLSDVVVIVVVVVGFYSNDWWRHSSHSGWLDQFKSSYNEKHDGVHHGMSENPDPIPWSLS